jgi:hypothetical protein
MNIYTFSSVILKNDGDLKKIGLWIVENLKMTSIFSSDSWGKSHLDLIIRETENNDNGLINYLTKSGLGDKIKIVNPSASIERGALNLGSFMLYVVNGHACSS